MSNTGDRFLNGTQFNNISVTSDALDDGSIQASGTLYVNTIKEYNTEDPGVNVEGCYFEGGKGIITSTQHSTNSTTAALLVYGGMNIFKESTIYSILSLTNTTNSYNTSDGSLLINGGIGLKQNLNVGGILKLFNTQPSYNNTSGSLISLGGISIQNTTDSISYTSGGALTISGGASIAKTLFTNLLNTNNASISNLNAINLLSNNLTCTIGNFNSLSAGNIISFNISSNNLINNNSTISNLNLLYGTFENINISNISAANEYITNSTITNLTSNTSNLFNFNASIGNIDTLTVGNLHVNNNFEYNDIVTNLSTANIVNNFATMSSLLLSNGTFGTLYGSFLNINNITNDNLINTNITNTNLFNANLLNTNITNTNLLNTNLININLSSSNFNAVNETVSNSVINIATIGSLKINNNLDLNNNIIVNVTSPTNLLDVTNKYYVDNSFNNFTIGNLNGNFTKGQVIVASTSGNIISYSTFMFDNDLNLLSLYGTNDSTSLTDGGTLQVYGGASIHKQLFVGGNTHFLGYLDMNNQKITSVDTPTTFYDAANKYYVDNKFDQFTIGNVSGNFTQGQVIIASTNGNITGFDSFTFNTSGMLSILTTTNALSLTNGGALTVAGGAAFGSDIYTQGITYFKNTTESNSTTSGSVLVSGGLAVEANISANAIILPSIIPPIYNNIIDNTSQFYLDTNDNLFKSIITTSGTLTTYQPTNTKGDLLTHNGITQVRLPVGVNGQILSVNSNIVDGIQWTTGIPSFSGINTLLQIYLSGNDNSTSCVIIEKPQGAFIDCVYPITKHGPSANFFFTKSFSSQYGHIIINNGNPSNDNGIILAEYNPYQGIELYKTTNGSNGLFIQNNNQLFLGSTIQLSSTNLTTTNFVSTYGAYFISISAQNNGPAATFIITKSNPLLNSCQITKISSSPGTNNCNLYIQWYSSSPFSIYKTTNDNDDYYTIIDNFPNINVFTISLTGTNTVYLEKNTFNFYEKKSFFIKITYNTTNGPCSIFSMSKNNHTVSGNKTTYQSPGKNTLEKIIFNWDSNSLPSISKTGVNYNGIYNVEISVF
jgi:hypothetical protein